jgi:MYXO-CTERM domain-containing protein
LLSGALSFAPVPAHADIPADYAGTPYQGKPSVIPGRVELANVDLGGSGVAWHADHNRTNSAGYEPISGNDYRPDDKNLPNICKTNVNPPPDAWVNGDPYPSATDKSWYYIGYAHAVDWVKVTVDVQVSGMYTVSSNWASAGSMWGLSIWFNDGHSPVDPARPHDGVNKSGVVVMPGTSDYHKWKAYPSFATFHLDAGLQVMTFHLEKYDHLQYGFLQFDLVGADGGAPDVGGADGDAVDGGGTPGDASMGAAGATGAAGQAGASVGGAGTGGAAGAPASIGAAGVAATGLAGSSSGGAAGGAAGGAPGARSPSGCAAAPVAPSAGAAVALTVLVLAARRRRRSGA